LHNQYSFRKNKKKKKEKEKKRIELIKIIGFVSFFVSRSDFFFKSLI